MAKRRRTVDAMAKRRTVDAMAKRRTVDTMAKRRTVDTMAKIKKKKRTNNDVQNTTHKT
jgi:hypothetical protein